MIKGNNRHHYIHHASLILLLLIGFVLFFQFRGFPYRQIFISSIIASIYVIWGIIHHYLKGDLHIRIVLEYSLIAILSIVIVWGAVLR